MRVRIEDVANQAGVSMKTVSRVLNNEPGVREATRAKVLETVAAMNYRPDPSARSLAGLIDKWKVLLSKTSSEHAGQTDRSGTKRVFSRIEVMPPGSAATESYLIVGPFVSRKEAENAAAYLRTKFVRWLVSTILLTQNISKSMFEFVPGQDFMSSWSDEDLNSKYGLNDDEIALIERSIRSLESANDKAD